LRIAFYYPWVYPYLVDLAEALKHRGEQVTVYSTGIFGNYPHMKKLEKCIRRIPSIRFLDETIVHPRLFLEVLRNKPNFLVIWNTESLPSLLLYVTAKARSIPTLLLVEKNKDTRYLLPLHIRILSTVKRLSVKLIHKNATALLAESEAAKDYLLQMRCHADRIHVYVHGVDVERFQQKRKNLRFAQEIGISERDLEKVVVLHLGGFNAHKGVEDLANALLNNDFDDNIFIMLKYGSLLQHYESPLQQRKNVRLIPQITQEDMPELYSLADIVIHPSIITAGGAPVADNVLLEAMACGKAIIATDVGANSFIISDCGILIPERDAEAIAQATIKLSSDNELRERYAKMARQRAEEVLSMEKYADKILELYEAITRGRN